MKYFVWYRDGYYDDGDIDLESFDTKPEALEFISKRISYDPSRTLSDYTLIKGKQLNMQVVNVVTAIQVLNDDC